uniref:Uncharacterized protein n=1 Tax=Anguilla anguilla TaxID=7936 RepID=A0A0E9W2C7_ANGAN
MYYPWKASQTTKILKVSCTKCLFPAC